MTDWSNLVLGADLSHYQHRPDFGQLQADGVRFVIIKAMQSGIPDPDFAWNRSQAISHGIPWLPYAYAVSSDGASAMMNFCNLVGRGSRIPAALDWEATGTPSSVIEAWMQTCETVLGRPGIAYYGIDPPEPVTDLIATWPRWLPEFTNGGDPRLPAWDGKLVPTDWSEQWLIWQYTGSGRLPGVSGAIDLDRLACPLDVFNHWYATGDLLTWAPLPGNAPPLVPTARILYLHCSGDDVFALQTRLSWLGFQCATDGRFGPQTKGAVQDFQMGNGLATDGIAGPLTISAINKAVP